MSHHQKDPERVAAGLKASIHNPRVSEQAKEHAQQELRQMGAGGQQLSSATSDPISEEVRDHPNKNEGNVVGGYKATLKNPRVSQEAKDHAEEVLREHNVDISSQETK